MAITMSETNSVHPRLTQLAKATKSRNDTTEEFYVLVGHTGGEVNLSNAEEAEALRIFRHGSCLVFAYAAALVTGFPIAIFTDSQPGQAWVGHAALQLPNGEFFDIAGMNSYSEIRRNFNFAHSDIQPTIYATPEDAHVIFNDNIGDNGAFGYLLAHINELGMLVTFHFVEQLLNYYDMEYNRELLRTMEKATIAYARKAKKKA
jgi:hypothetical protein